MWLAYVLIVAIPFWAWIYYEVKNSPELDENGNIVERKKDKN